MQTPAERGTGESPTRRHSDRELVSRFLSARDESAFAEIVTRYSRLVMSVAQHTLRDPHAAEDAFQATFLVLARSARRIRNRDSLASWLHGTTFRVSKRLLRTRLRRKEQDLPSVELPAPWATPPRPDEQAALDEELARLSEGLRGPLVLHYLEGRTVPEIAAELKMTQSAVEGRLKRGKQTLRKRLLKRGVLLSSAVFGAGLTVPVEAGVAGALLTATVAVCLKATTSATLAPIAASTIQQIALQEMAAMTRIALMKMALVCGGVAGAIGLAGAGANGSLGMLWAGATDDSTSAATESGAGRFEDESFEAAPGLIQTVLAQVPSSEPLSAKHSKGGAGDSGQLKSATPEEAKYRDLLAKLNEQVREANKRLESQSAGDADRTTAASTDEFSPRLNISTMPATAVASRAIAAHALARPLSVNSDQAKLSDVLRQISDATGVKFIMDSNVRQRDGAVRYDLATKGIKLNALLDSVLSEMPGGQYGYRIEDDGVHIFGPPPEVLMEISGMSDAMGMGMGYGSENGRSGLSDLVRGRSRRAPANASEGAGNMGTMAPRFGSAATEGTPPTGRVDLSNAPLEAGPGIGPLNVTGSPADGPRLNLLRQRSAEDERQIGTLEETVRALQARVEQMREEQAREKKRGGSDLSNAAAGEAVAQLPGAPAGLAEGTPADSDVKVISPDDAIKTPSIRAHVEQSLKQPAQLQFPGVTLEEALHYIAAHYKMPVIAERGAMKQAGVSMDVEVFAGVKGIPLAEALQVILGSVKEDGLTFQVEDDGLHIRPRPMAKTQAPSIAENRGQRQAAAGAPPSATKVEPKVVQTFQSQKPSEERIREALDSSNEFQFTGQTLQEVMNYLSAENGITIRLDAKALSQAGVGPDQEINLIVNDLSLRSALELMLEDVGGTPLDYFIENEVLKVTTKEVADAKIQTVIYDASSLGAVYAPHLLEIIQQAVEPQSWYGQGGKGAVVSIGNSVVVTTTRRLHDKVAEIMRMLEQHATSMQQ